MTDHAPDASTRRDWFSTMVRIRAFEDKVQELFMSGEIGGTTHLCQGQEAVSVGSIAAMEPGDVQTNTYRGHGEALALGMTPETAFAELMGKSDRRLGWRRWLDAPHRLLEGQHRGQRDRRRRAADRAGAAVGFQMQRRPNVALTFFGDGATNIGTFHEALNMAAVWKAPVVFIIVEQPVRRVLPAGDDDGRRRPRPAGRSVRDPGPHRRRPGHRRRARAPSATRSRGRGPARGRPCSR